MTDSLPWNSLVFGSYNKQEVKLAIADIVWQNLRYSMLDEPLDVKFSMLKAYLAEGTWPLELRRICVTNYVNALARSGLIPPASERSS